MPAGSLNVAYRARWEESQGPDRYRRGLYIFLQRSVPYPQLVTFDAPASLVTCSRRERSTTPLQALTLLNDPVFFEAARSLALRVLREAPGDLPRRIDYAYELCLSRPPKDSERERITRYYYEKRRRQETNTIQIVAEMPGAAAMGLDPAEAAAWVQVSSILLNLDEFITRE